MQIATTMTTTTAASYARMQSDSRSRAARAGEKKGPRAWSLLMAFMVAAMMWTTSLPPLQASASRSIHAIENTLPRWGHAVTHVVAIAGSGLGIRLAVINGLVAHVPPAA